VLTNRTQNGNPLKAALNNIQLSKTIQTNSIIGNDCADLGVPGGKTPNLYNFKAVSKNVRLPRNVGGGVKSA
jgi:hypothetical protein